MFFFFHFYFRACTNCGSCRSQFTGSEVYEINQNNRNETSFRVIQMGTYTMNDTTWKNDKKQRDRQIKVASRVGLKMHIFHFWLMLRRKPADELYQNKN